MERKFQPRNTEGPIVEIAPYDLFKNYLFDGVEFTGCGPVVFVNCQFWRCFPRHIPQAEFRKCVDHGQRNRSHGEAEG